MKLKLIHKLLLALFVSTALVLVLFAMITRASIGSGFVDFLQQQESEQVQQLALDLQAWYASNGSWDELLERPRIFHELVSETLSESGEDQTVRGPEGRRPPPREARGGAPGQRGQRPPPAGQRASNQRPAGQRPAGQRPPGQRAPGPGNLDGPPPGGPQAFHLRLYLLDSDKSLLIGQRPADSDENAPSAIVFDNAIVGWLGVSTRRGIELPAERDFLAQQRNNLLIGLAIGLTVAVLLAWFLARHLSRPINEVAEGIHALASGNFDHRLARGGGDEIAQLADDVDSLAVALGEHETARKRWMSDIAHELRTPLAIITGELEAIRDGVRPLDMQQLSSVEEEAKHLASLISDLHNLALTDSGALAYKMERLDFGELVQMMVDTYQKRAAKKGLRLSYSRPAQKVSIDGDEQRLLQLLRNLLDNSVRYTDEGGHIGIELQAGPEQLRLTISDTAPGASATECERLFDRLYRVEGSRNRNSGGSGLGLSICHNIVTAHGGQINAVPGADGGILFTINLPVKS